MSIRNFRIVTKLYIDRASATIVVVCSKRKAMQVSMACDDMQFYISCGLFTVI